MWSVLYDLIFKNMDNIKHTFKKLESIFRVFLFTAFILNCNEQIKATPESYASQVRFSVAMNNSTIQSVLNYIEENSEFVFLYDGNKNFINERVSIEVENKSVNDILDELFRGSKVSYEIDGKQIILTQRADKAANVRNAGPKKTINGIVTDANSQEPIAGATVMVKGTTNGAITSVNGDFSLTCSKGDTLSVSYIGYKEKELIVKDINIYSIELVEDVELLNEVVVTAFGIAQKKENMVGAIQQIRPSELKVPSASLSTSFAGRMAGVIAVQRTGEPGADGADFWIRGKSTFSGATGALIIIDGMQASAQELNALDPEVIEGFSILKDATATAMYGTLGANGVMVVTTKQGEIKNKPVINFRIEGSMSSLSDVPQMVDGVRFMELYNDAAARPDASAIPYSEAKIANTRNGLNPILYPNLNWYNELFKDHSFGQKVNLNIRGGGSKADYFMSVSVKHNDGNLKSLSKDYYSFNNNINVVRYDFVNNLNVKLTKTTKVSLGLNVGLKDYDGPVSGASHLFGIVMDANPVDFPIKYPKQQGDSYIRWGGKTGGAQGVAYPNPVAELVKGTSSNFSSTVTANIKLSQDLSMITKGLKFTGAFYFKNNTYSGVVRSSGYNQFEVSNINDETGEYQLSMVGDEKNTTLTTTPSGNTGNRNMYLQGTLEYARTFGKVHDVNAMLLYNQNQYSTNTPSDLYSSLPQRKQGIAGRLAYSYDGRYMLEANFGYNGSENFAKGHRFGFFPSVGVGYSISREAFWKKMSKVISSMKIRASWGLVGNDNTGAGRFSYMEDIALNSSKYFYSTGVFGSYTPNIKGPVYNRFFNPELTWEVGEKLNIGIDTQWFNCLNINMEWFREIRKNIFQERYGTTPAIMGINQSKIYGNYGKMENRGFDVAIDYNKQINRSLFLSFKGTFTYAHNKVIERNEPNFMLYPNLSVKGGSIGRHLVYVANGLFPDQNTIDANAQQSLGSVPIPGDLWYQDIADVNGNYNGIITNDDRVYMGKPADPEIIYGFGPSIKFKGWDFSFFFQGAARTSLMMSNFFPFGDKKIRGVLDFVADDCWTLENQNPNAKFPRLKISDNQNNAVNSSYWLRNAAFLKLKNAEIGYTYKKMRVYLTGSNLLTFSPFKYWDPEMGGGNGLKYPTLRTFNIGFQMTIN